MTSTLSDFITADQVDTFVTHESLKHAAKLQEKAQDILNSLEILREEYEERVEPLQQEARQLLETRDRIIREHQAKGVEREGPFSIVVDKKPREVLDDAAFREKYPAEHRAVFDEVGYRKFKASKDDAKIELTSHQIEKICKKQGEYTYRIDTDLRSLIPEKSSAGVEL